MHTYLIMPEGCRWLEVYYTTPEMAYRSVCSDYPPKKRIAVLDMETGAATVYTRTLDSAGNVLDVIKEAHICK